MALWSFYFFLFMCAFVKQWHVAYPLICSSPSLVSSIPCSGGCKLNTNSPPNVTKLEAFLEVIQSQALESFGSNGFDAKNYLDLPLKKSLADASLAFSKLPRSNGSVITDKFRQFENDYFDLPGNELENATFTDYVEQPTGFLPLVVSPAAREFALKIHKLWFFLSRKVSKTVASDPERHTLLPLPNIVVVPGSRFREVYYWDTYWIVRGLLVSKMYDTAKLVVYNLLSLGHSFGFVPNGARTYYKNRSQPPLLSEAVRAVYNATGDICFVRAAFPVLVQEHKFWSRDPHKVNIRDKNGVVHTLTRYSAMWNKPRPESYTIDVETAKNLSGIHQKELYHQIASTAETGWDFSSRWMADRENLTSLKTTYIVPVDLNSYMLQIETNIAFFANILGRNKSKQRFQMFAEARRKAIDAILWNEEMGQWLDYWTVGRDSKTRHESEDSKIFTWKSANQNKDIFVSNFVPLWCGVVTPGDRRVSKIVASLKNSGLILSVGIVTSLRETHQQWDYPNAWAPLQHIIIEGLESTGSAEASEVAKGIAQRWIRTNYAQFATTGEMREKYDARNCGKGGSGGEYLPQAGFGWSNGVVLALLEKYGWPQHLNLTCPTS